MSEKKKQNEVKAGDQSSLSLCLSSMLFHGLTLLLCARLDYFMNQNYALLPKHRSLQCYTLFDFFILIIIQINLKPLKNKKAKLFEFDFFLCARLDYRSN